jgi:hypothetical protein
MRREELDVCPHSLLTDSGINTKPALKEREVVCDVLVLLVCPT